MTTLTATRPRTQTVGPGRPRHTGKRSMERSGREEILDQAGRLFVEQSYSGTSTREIADACGIRQSSIYYHFHGKTDILIELLEQSVRPTLDKVTQIEAQCPANTPAAALYLLALTDVRTLATLPHNIGRLHRMPDVRNADTYRVIEPTIHELARAYARLGMAIASEEVARTMTSDQLGAMLLQMVEVVTKTRADGGAVSTTEAHAIAASCLRVCGVTQSRIAESAAIGAALAPVLVDGAVSRAGTG